MNSNRIVIFDSGAGGLSVASEILNLIPRLNIDYVADLDGFPYGIMAEDVLKHRVTSIIKHISALHGNPALAVIACNTASTVLLDSLRTHFTGIEFVGVVPAIKPAVAMSKSGVIGMLATSATIARPYTQGLIRKYAAGKRVVAFGSEALVFLAEGLAQNREPLQKHVDDELVNFMTLPYADHIDTMILACTHFPLISQHIRLALGRRSVALVDSGEAIARRVASLLTGSETSLHNSTPSVRILVNHNQDPHNAIAKYYARCLQNRLCNNINIETLPLALSF